MCRWGQIISRAVITQYVPLTLTLIRYSARLLHRTHICVTEDITQVVVAAGTVFNEVVMWRPDASEAKKVDILHNLTGHKVCVHCHL